MAAPLGRSTSMADMLKLNKSHPVRMIDMRPCRGCAQSASTLATSHVASARRYVVAAQYCFMGTTVYLKACQRS